MLRILVVPFTSFKERIRLVREYLDLGFRVEVEDDYLLCIGKTKPMEEI